MLYNLCTKWYKNLEQYHQIRNFVKRRIMNSGIEKVTLSLNRELLEKLATRARKSMSEFVRDLIQREKDHMEMEQELMISPEIQKLRGCLKPADGDTKQRLHRAAREKLR
jgi:predicted CopG family antitoxin